MTDVEESGDGDTAEECDETDETPSRRRDYVSPDEAEKSPEYYDHAEQYSRSRVVRRRRR